MKFRSFFFLALFLTQWGYGIIPDEGSDIVIVWEGEEDYGEHTPSSEHENHHDDGFEGEPIETHQDVLVPEYVLILPKKSSLQSSGLETDLFFDVQYCNWFQYIHSYALKIPEKPRAEYRDITLVTYSQRGPPYFLS